jgi:putative spermidine/putrescine transport system ATP-binding protein
LVPNRVEATKTTADERSAGPELRSLPLELIKVNKKLSSTFELRELSLRVNAGEFFCLLGPSGSGKSTLLGLIGGWINPDCGRVVLGTTDYTGIPPFERPVRTCFQKAGFLFPHLTVAQNIGYALAVKGVSRTVIESRVKLLAQRVGLTGLENRKPSQISGGEAQRVAIARALADPQPILLLDEIQTGLDRHLRSSIRNLLVDLTQDLHVTTLYVTHDATEALGLASRLESRLGVLNKGQIVQIGTATEVYRSPRTSFVANFIGDVNLLLIKHQEPNRFITTGGTVLTISTRSDAHVRYVAIRPEAITLRNEGESMLLNGVVETIELLGPVARIGVRVNNDSVSLHSKSFDDLPTIGGRVNLYFSEKDLVILAE